MDGYIFFISIFMLYFTLIAEEKNEVLFSIILGLFAAAITQLPLPNEKLAAVGISFLAVSFLPTLLFYYRKKLSSYYLASLSIFLTIASYSVFSNYNNIYFGVEIPAIIGILIIMYYSAVLEMVAHTFERMIVYSSSVQFLVIILFSLVGKMTNTTILHNIRLMGYLIANIPFLTVIILASRSGNYNGILRKNNILGFSFLVSCLAMAGLPSLSIFVSEFIVLIASMAINKILTLLIVFFITICFVLYAGYIFPALMEKEDTINANKYIIAFCIASTVITIILGVIPSLQFDLVGAFKW